MSLSNKNIIVGITAGIAAYKTVELVRLLVKAGANVQVVMSRSAREFVTPLTLSAISGTAVREALFDVAAENAMSHIELARWADLLVIAPTSANTLAKLVQGLAEDLLTTLVLATEAPVLLAPAMNRVMWQQSVTQDNLQKLIARGFHCIGPESGLQACGEEGYGRMVEPTDIFNEIVAHFSEKKLSGKKVLITAGPTREAIDPVRYLTNHSSGIQGFALARAARYAGAEVVLVSGPTELAPPPGVTVINVESAAQMEEAVQANLASVDVFIGAAAVADYRLPEVSAKKLKKSGDKLTLELVPNPDIIAKVANSGSRPALVVGFAAETNDVEKYARQKIKAKKLDMIVANQVGFDQGFGAVDNAVSIYFKNGEVVSIPATSKDQIAKAVIEAIVF